MKEGRKEEEEVKNERWRKEGNGGGMINEGRSKEESVKKEVGEEMNAGQKAMEDESMKKEEETQGQEGV